MVREGSLSGFSNIQRVASFHAVPSSYSNFMSELSGIHVTEYQTTKPSQVYFDNYSDNSVIFYYNTYCSYCFLEPIRFGVNSAFGRFRFFCSRHLYHTDWPACSSRNNVNAKFGRGYYFPSPLRGSTFGQIIFTVV